MEPDTLWLKKVMDMADGPNRVAEDRVLHGSERRNKLARSSRVQQCYSSMGLNVCGLI